MEAARRAMEAALREKQADAARLDAQVRRHPSRLLAPTQHALFHCKMCNGIRSNGINPMQLAVACARGESVRTAHAASISNLAVMEAHAAGVEAGCRATEDRVKEAQDGLRRRREERDARGAAAEAAVLLRAQASAPWQRERERD
jgi:hypothetical protein